VSYFHRIAGLALSLVALSLLGGSANAQGCPGGVCVRPVPYPTAQYASPPPTCQAPVAREARGFHPLKAIFGHRKRCR